MWEIGIFTNVDLHLDWSKLRPAHFVTLLNHPVKCWVHSHSRVRAVTCNTHVFTLTRISVPHFLKQKHQPTAGFSKHQQFKAAEDVSEASVSTKRIITRAWTKSRRQKQASNWKCYPGRRFPKARCRKTRRHSRTCTRSRKCSLETSTWPADEPAGDMNASIFLVFYCTRTGFSHMSFFLKELKLIVLLQKREYFQWLNIIFQEKYKIIISWILFRCKIWQISACFPVLF